MNNFSGGLKRFIKNIYAYSFFNSLMFFAPIYAIFMQENGVSDIGLSTLFIMYSVGTMVAQIPSAWLIGKIGKKNSIILGQVLKILCFVFWFFVPCFWSFALGFLLWGAQGAIYNVAYESLLYEELKAYKKCGIYARVLGRRKLISTIGSSLSALGSLLLFWGYGFVVLLSVISMVASIYFIIKIKPKSKSVNSLKPVKKVQFIKLLKTGAKVVMRTPCILYLILLTTMVGNFSYLDDYFGLVSLEVGIRKEFVGIVVIFISFCGMLGGLIAYKFEKIKDFRLYILIAIAGSVLVLFSIFYSIAGILLLGFAYVIFSVVRLLLYSRFQDFVPDKYRPIALSLYSFSDSVMYILAMFSMGLGSALGGWRYSILFAGMVCIFLSIWAILFIKDKCSIKIIAPKNIKSKSTSSNSPLKF